MTDSPSVPARPIVVLPYELDDVPGGLDVLVWDGRREPDADLSEVRFFALPYDRVHPAVDLLARMPVLEVAQLQTAGYENVQPYVPTGVILCNARGVHDTSTAELAVLLILASLRGLPEFVRNQGSGRWAHSTRDSLADKRVVIVGYGSIGQALHRRLQPFECEVVAVARTARDGVHAINELPDLLPSADVVVLLTPLTEQTAGLVDAPFLARMRDGALLVNVSRGKVVDTDALMAEVSSGRLRAGLDVTDPEPLAAEHPLWTAPGVLITPHVGGNTTAFLPRSKALVGAQLARWVAGEPLANVID